jgi:hypothetical protein
LRERRTLDSTAEGHGRAESTMVRVARWLVAEVRQGGVFTKEQMRSAFPGVSQIDRRMRDLRDYGWVVHTNREDATLAQSELRFVQEGDSVWDPRKRRELDRISGQQRREALARADYLCEVCGISGGQMYFAPPAGSAVLSVSARSATFRVECQRCRAGDARFLDAIETTRVRDLYDSLTPAGRETVLDWLTNGRRSSPEERVWSSLLRSRELSEELLNVCRQNRESENG